MTVVAIHQPNYLPWLGYFSKMLQADIFIFLDDAQYTKNSYINRVRVLCNGLAKWLTIPMRVPLGTPIRGAAPSAEWAQAHLDRLANYYQRADHRDRILADLKEMFAATDKCGNIADINTALIRDAAGRLGIKIDFRLASTLDCGDKRADDRLVELVRAIDPAGVYLSGSGASSYQDPDKFQAAGLGLRMTKFEHPVYAQGEQPFVPGLSLLDALFWLGWERTGAMLCAATAA
jgi:hypothetical protein